MTAADDCAREVAEFLDVWDAAPAHRTGYRDVISSQKSGDPEGGRKLRASVLRNVLAEVQRLREAHASLAAALDGVCVERDQRARESDEANAERNRLARQLADRGDEYDTLRAEFDQFADTCASHSADRCVEQVAAEDLQAAYDRLGEQAQRITEAASRFRAERDRLHDALSEVLAEPWDLDDPALRGFARTRWVVAERLDRWRGVLAGVERSERDGDPDVCRDCYGRGDDFEGGACPRCHGTGAAP